MWQWLDRQLPEGVRVISSPAVRCEQTVKALGRKVKFKTELYPEGSMDDLLVTAVWPSSKMSVLIVGHLPVLGKAIAYLLGLPHGGCCVQKWRSLVAQESGERWRNTNCGGERTNTRTPLIRI